LPVLLPLRSFVAFSYPDYMLPIAFLSPP